MKNIKATIYIKIEAKLLITVIDNKYYDYINNMFVKDFYRLLQTNQLPIHRNIVKIFRNEMMK